MGYEESLRTVRFVAIIDMIMSIFPIAFYTVVVFIFGFVVLVGAFNTGYDFLDWILTNTMSIQETKVDIDHPGQAADLRMFRCSVWGVAILFNLLELTMAFVLMQATRRSKHEGPFMAWMALKFLIVSVMGILLIALWSSGSAFVGTLTSLFYLIYRCIALWLVYRHVKNIRDLGGVP